MQHVPEMTHSQGYFLTGFENARDGMGVGAILKLPPLKRALANRQLQSRYLERLFARSKL